jgi:2'-5' RNA ligase
MVRVFVAVDLSSEALKELEKFIGELIVKRWPVRWEVSSKLHITLFFVGWVDEEKIEEIKDVVEKGIRGIGSFSIRMGKFGVFPDFIQPRVIWLGIKGDQPELVRLQKEIAKQLVGVGFESEKRAWVPHLTIGRVKKEARRKAKKELGRQLQKLEINPAKLRREVNEFQEISLINEVVVYQSILKPTGSEYKKLYEIPLS